MLDPILLQSFLAVAQTRSFTEAGRRLGVQQSTVSQHVRRLEEEAGRRLFVRDTHRVVPTGDGEAMLGFARSILEANERAREYFSRARLRGRVRFGTSDDFVSTRLPEILREFTRRHPGVDLELTVDLSATLNLQIDRGELDVVLAKRRSGAGRGTLVWRDQLTWIGGPGMSVDPQAPLPLILYAPPSLSRAMALETLERNGRAWRMVCTSGSLSGLRAAALAGLGVMLHARSLIPEGLAEAPATLRLPAAGEVEFVVARRRGARGPETALADTILANADRLQQA
ncbi:MAG TPA: LysR substrate-binding domain-containing protein [Acidisphaera sp.]|nr:LysR substrate-binding domain-containing protein [Acidisphaera sp.]